MSGPPKRAVSFLAVRGGPSVVGVGAGRREVAPAEAEGGWSREGRSRAARRGVSQTGFSFRTLGGGRREPRGRVRLRRGSSLTRPVPRSGPGGPRDVCTVLSDVSMLATRLSLSLRSSPRALDNP